MAGLASLGYFSTECHPLLATRRAGSEEGGEGGEYVCAERLASEQGQGGAERGDGACTYAQLLLSMASEAGQGNGGGGGEREGEEGGGSAGAIAAEGIELSAIEAVRRFLSAWEAEEEEEEKEEEEDARRHAGELRGAGGGSGGVAGGRVADKVVDTVR